MVYRRRDWAIIKCRAGPFDSLDAKAPTVRSDVDRQAGDGNT
jgi:hypothetical protein